MNRSSNESLEATAAALFRFHGLRRFTASRLRRGAVPSGCASVRRWMNTYLPALVLVLAIVTGCSSISSRWNPDAAVTDAEHDIASRHLRFAYVGGFVPSAPGVPLDG